MIDMHTVGAGGGSIAWRDAGGALRVGPRSAGAEPGPACYGRGGEEPTVTDANLLLGRLDPTAPLAGGVELDRDAAERAIAALAGELGMSARGRRRGHRSASPSSEMAQAVRVLTVERGIDPRELALVAFGGAGPLHGAAIADELGIRRVIVPLESGVLSALGLAVSERRRDVVESRAARRAGDHPRRGCGRGRAARRARARGARRPIAEVRATYELRYAGQAFELPVEVGPAPRPEELRGASTAAHERRYGYADDDAELELVTVRVAAALPGRSRARRYGRSARAASTLRRDGRRARCSGPEVDGPRLELPEATLVVPPGRSGRGRC